MRFRSIGFFLQRETKTLSQDYQNFVSLASAQNNTVPSSSKHVPLVLPSLSTTSLVLSSNQKPIVIMANRFAPLVLPANLHDLPQGYGHRLKQFGEEGDIIAQQHLDKFLYFCDLEEIDYEDVKMRLFSQRLSGEVKKWFMVLPLGSIIDS